MKPIDQLAREFVELHTAYRAGSALSNAARFAAQCADTPSHWNHWKQTRDLTMGIGEKMCATYDEFQQACEIETGEYGMKTSYWKSRAYELSGITEPQFYLPLIETA